MSKYKRFPGVRVQIRNLNGTPTEYYSIRYYVNNKQHEEGIGFKSSYLTQEIAYKKLAELKTKILNNEAYSLKEITEKELEKREEIKKNEKTLNEISELYFQNSQINKRKSTFVREKILYDKWVKPFFGTFPLARITPDRLISYWTEISKVGLAPRTQNYPVRLIRQIINFALRCGYYKGQNGASNFQFLKEDNARTKFLTNEELELLLNALKNRSYQVYLSALISVDCGLRAGEIFKLTWGDINLDKKEMHIKDPKNHKSRYAFMTNRVHDELQKIIPNDQSQLLIKARTGRSMEHVSRTFERIVNELGFNKNKTDRREKVVFHTLRHTCASRLAAKGVGLEVIGKILGHSSIRTTQRYAHLTDTTLKNSINLLNETN